MTSSACDVPLGFSGPRASSPAFACSHTLNYSEPIPNQQLLIRALHRLLLRPNQDQCFSCEENMHRFSIQVMSRTVNKEQTSPRHHVNCKQMQSTVPVQRLSQPGGDTLKRQTERGGDGEGQQLCFISLSGLRGPCSSFQCDLIVKWAWLRALTRRERSPAEEASQPRTDTTLSSPFNGDEREHRHARRPSAPTPVISHGRISTL